MYDITSGRSFTYYGFWVLFSTFILLNIYMFIQEQSGYVALVQPPPQINQLHTNVSGGLTKNSKGPPKFPKKYISDEAVSEIVANARNKFSSISRWPYFQLLFSVFKSFLYICIIHVSFSEPFVRAMVVTSWRSGSTLTGELLNSLPGSFYSYEPLSLFGIDRIYNGSKHVQSAINVIKGIFECDYTIVHKECTFKEKPKSVVIWYYFLQ